MSIDEIKKVIVETFTEQNAFRDLPPANLVSLTVDMIVEILKKEKTV
jgi:hypothetical protein